MGFPIFIRNFAERLFRIAPYFCVLCHLHEDETAEFGFAAAAVARPKGDGRTRNAYKSYSLMQNIGVFLSSHSEVPAAYHEAARQVGQWIGETRRTLLYGGSSIGLMEVLARAAKEAGARVFGIVPQFVVDRNHVSETLDVEIRTAALSDRKTVIIDRSDVLVALPGGVGTLDEVFTLLAGRTANETHKRVILYDVDGCWQPLIALLDRLVEAGLYSADERRQVGVAGNIAELEMLCR